MFFVAGKIIFELFADICPKKSDNFRALCTGREVRINVDTCTTTTTTNYFININNNSNDNSDNNNNIIFRHDNDISYILHVNVSVLELMCGWLYLLVSGIGS